MQEERLDFDGYEDFDDTEDLYEIRFCEKRARANRRKLAFHKKQRLIEGILFEGGWNPHVFPRYDYEESIGCLGKRFSTGMIRYTQNSHRSQYLKKLYNRRFRHQVSKEDLPLHEKRIYRKYGRYAISWW